VEAALLIRDNIRHRHDIENAYLLGIAKVPSEPSSVQAKIVQRRICMPR
jgi:hypothetical protein